MNSYPVIFVDTEHMQADIQFQHVHRLAQFEPLQTLYVHIILDIFV